MTPGERLGQRLADRAQAHADSAVVAYGVTAGRYSFVERVIAEAWLAGYAAGSVETVATMHNAVALLNTPAGGRG